MAKAHKLPSGKWRCQIFISEDHIPPRMSFTADTAGEAEFLALQYKREYKRKQSPENLTVGEAIDKYIENRSVVLSPRTIKGYKEDRARYFQSIMDIRLPNLSQEDVQKAVNADAKSYSPKTIRNMHGLLSATLAKFYPDFSLHTHLPQKKKRLDDITPEDEDIERLIKATEGQRIQIAIILGACVGLRRSEISALKRSDINEKNSTITVQRAMVLNDEDKWTIKGTKTYESTRVLDVDPIMIQKILALEDRGEYIVGLLPSTITRTFWEVRNELGLSFRYHDLRHYNASIQHALGIPDKYIMQRGGWSTDYTMKRVYRHALQKKTKEASSLINDHMKNFIQSEQDS